uniref:Uncharacterized protein n=1 Tax=Leptobrachium leishanense TaxID=445787 RepID=A0A8C5LKB0_9ANUR
MESQKWGTLCFVNRAYCLLTASLLLLSLTHETVVKTSMLSSSVSPQISEAFINETWMRRYGIPVPHEKQTLMWSLLVSMFSIGGLMGSAGSGYLIGKFGNLNPHLLLVLNRELFGTEALWHHILLVSGLISFLQLVTLPFFPESPTYLLLDKGDKDGCVRGEYTDHQPYIDEMMKEQVSIKNVRKMSILELLKDPSHRCQLFVSICLIFCMQLSGVNAVKYFQQLRRGHWMLCLTGNSSPITYVAKMVGYITRLHRRKTWLIHSSISTKFPGFVIIGCSTWVGMYILGMAFPYIEESLKQFCFLLFMAITALFLVCTYFFVPETKDKTIEEISQEFNKFNFRKQFKENKTAISECTLGTRL